MSAGLLTKLRNLRLYKTGISEVPLCVTRLVNLVHRSRLPVSAGQPNSLDGDAREQMELDFGECNLRELPEGITALTKLKILRLDNNKLNHLPEHLFDALDLTELTSADNLGISTAGVEERMVTTLFNALGLEDLAGVRYSC
jgi:Leucine-rich repeat (LRR) protein